MRGGKRIPSLIRLLLLLSIFLFVPLSGQDVARSRVILPVVWLPYARGETLFAKGRTFDIAATIPAHWTVQCIGYIAMMQFLVTRILSSPIDWVIRISIDLVIDLWI